MPGFFRLTAKLTTEHKAFLARVVEEGPVPAIHGLVRWRACDLIMRLHEEFGLSNRTGQSTPGGASLQPCFRD